MDNGISKSISVGGIKHSTFTFIYSVYLCSMAMDVLAIGIMLLKCHKTTENRSPVCNIRKNIDTHKHTHTLWLRFPSIATIKPTPHASCSFNGS